MSRSTLEVSSSGGLGEYRVNVLKPQGIIFSHQPEHWSSYRLADNLYQEMADCSRLLRLTPEAREFFITHGELRAASSRSMFTDSGAPKVEFESVRELLRAAHSFESCVGGEAELKHELMPLVFASLNASERLSCIYDETWSTAEHGVGRSRCGRRPDMAYGLKPCSNTTLDQHTLRRLQRQKFRSDPSRNSRFKMVFPLLIIEAKGMTGCVYDAENQAAEATVRALQILDNFADGEQEPENALPVFMMTGTGTHFEVHQAVTHMDGDQKLYVIRRIWVGRLTSLLSVVELLHILEVIRNYAENLYYSRVTRYLEAKLEPPVNPAPRESLQRGGQASDGGDDMEIDVGTETPSVDLTFPPLESLRLQEDVDLQRALLASFENPRLEPNGSVSLNLSVQLDRESSEELRAHRELSEQLQELDIGTRAVIDLRWVD